MVGIRDIENRGKILKDITFLLCLVSEELKLQGIRLNEPKHRWEDYENYLKVWDRKEKGWGLRKIAKGIYPENPPEEARRKVRNLLKQAGKMVEGGFSMIWANGGIEYPP